MLFTVCMSHLLGRSSTATKNMSICDCERQSRALPAMEMLCGANMVGSSIHKIYCLAPFTHVENLYGLLKNLYMSCFAIG